MSRSLKNRVEHLTARYGDLSDPMVRAQAIVRKMSREEINAELRECMLKNGYDPTLPHGEAITAYIALLEAKVPTLSSTDQECVRQEVELLRKGPNFLGELFPESPLPAEIA